MVVDRIHSNLFVQRANQHVLRLQEGQIVEGKVIKLYADQHAQVNIGQTSLVAQIETSLSVGKSYYFQVQDKNGEIYLRVLDGLKGQTGPLKLESLMKQLQIKVTDQNYTFIKQLINNGIPFQHQQLFDAIKLLDSSTNDKVTISVIQSMLRQKLPLTQSVMQALRTFETQDFSTLLQKVYAQIQNNDNLSTKSSEAMLMKHLETMIQRPMSLDIQLSQLMHNGMKKNQATFVLLQLLGLISENNTGKTTHKLQQFIQSQTAKHYPLESVETKEQIRQLFRQSEHRIDHIIANETDLRKTAMKIMSIFHPLKSGTVQSNDVSSLVHMIKSELTPLLPEKLNVNFTTLLTDMSKANQTTLLKYLQALVDETGYNVLKDMQKMTINHGTQQNMEELPIQQKFISHLSNMFQTLGLNMEHELVQALQNESQNQREELLLKQSQTIKSLLVHVLQQSGSSQENMQQLVHFINGLQLQSLTESNQMSQAQFIIPGNKLSLNKDMFIQFESQKQPDGTIDTDYCRIFFVLDLTNVRETMIDMQIQKRIISIMIYNDYLSGNNEIQAMQRELADNLSTLHYQLSTIQWKPLYDKKHAEPIINNVEKNQTKERYDFRI